MVISQWEISYKIINDKTEYIFFTFRGWVGSCRSDQFMIKPKKFNHSILMLIGTRNISAFFLAQPILKEIKFQPYKWLKLGDWEKNPFSKALQLIKKLAFSIVGN